MNPNIMAFSSRMSSTYRNILFVKEGSRDTLSLNMVIKSSGQSMDTGGTPDKTGR